MSYIDYPPDGWGEYREWQRLTLEEQNKIHRTAYDNSPEVIARRAQIKREQELRGIEIRRQLLLADPNVLALPLLAEVIVKLRAALAELGQTFKWSMLTDFWVGGLNKSGWAVTRGGEWVKSKNGWYRRPDGYSIDAPCLIDPPHRHELRNDASIQLVMLENAWLGYDEEHTTDKLCAQEVSRHVLTCPMCDDDIWSPTHERGHDPQRQWEDEEGNLHGSRSPFAYVLAEFELQVEIAKARWLVEHFEGANEAHLERAKALLTRAPTPATAIERGPSKIDWDEPTTIAWMEANKIPATASDAEAWRLAKVIPGHPPKNNAIEVYQRVRRLAADQPA